MNAVTHTSVREDIRKRIVAGEWALGEQMPGEIELANEYQCSRTTMNRALRALADEGIIERKRKRGTRVRPVPKLLAQIRIPIVREQVEAKGQAYSCKIVRRESCIPPDEIREKLELAADCRCSFVESLHLADEQPFAFEARWVNLSTVPEFEHADLAGLSANEWLVRMVPFSRGDVWLTASSADRRLADLLGTEDGAALFTMERTTWLDDRAVTTVRLHYAPGYRLAIEI